MSEKKISIIILGSGDSLKKALITNIIGKDLSTLTKKGNEKRLHLYENEAYEFRCTPCNDTVQEYTEVLFDKDPDKCLLVVEDGFSTKDVWKQIEKLSKTTQKPTEEFIVVLPFGYKDKESYPFNCCSMEQIVSDVRKLAEDRHPKRYKRPAENTQLIDIGGDEEEQPSFAKGNFGSLTYSGNTLNLILLGMAGTGKSASGNTILGRRQFFSDASSMPVTTECEVAETVIDGTRVRVIDTPDISDDEMESSVKKQHVAKCKQLCQSGPCVYLLVMNVGRLTHGERDIMKKFEKAFSKKVKEQTVILFTRGEELCRKQRNLGEFLHSCQPDLKKIVEQCGRRCVLFENNAPHPNQVAELMQTVNRMLNK